MPELPGPKDSATVAAIIRYVRKNAFLIDMTATGSFTVTWDVDAPVSGELVIKGYGKPAATESAPATGD